MTEDAWSAERYAANARFVSDLTEGVLDWLGPVEGLRVLDLGCGDGVLTERLAGAGADVVGVDASPDMVVAAKDRGVDARVMDGAALDLDGGFDVVFSNAALHWMTDPDAVIAGVRRALRPGGRFVGEFGGHGNVAAIRTALAAVTGGEDAAEGIWYFPTAKGYALRLEGGGFEVQRVALIPRPTPLVSGMAEWLETLAAPVLARFPEGEREALRDRATDLLAPALRDERGEWHADYVRLRFEARLATVPA